MLNKKKRLAIASLAFLSLFVCPLSKKNIITKTFALNSASKIWQTQISKYINNNYSKIKNQKVEGKYYKVGVMGHKRVVHFSDEIVFKIKEIETFTNSCSVGSVKDITITNNTKYLTGNKVGLTVKCHVAIEKLIKASLDLDDISNIGAESGVTVKTSLGAETYYWSEKISSTTVSYDLNLENILPYKIYFRYSKVACFIEAKILESYTLEQGMFGNWYRVANTTNKNYYARYFLADMCTFVYNDDTFGDKVIGEYSLNEIIKNY